MSKLDKSMLLGYSSEQMFSLVEDIESYPLFLPWCNRTLVKMRSETKTVATLYVHYLGVNAHITTENEKAFPEKMILRLIEGPFKNFEGIWHFQSISEKACKVGFHVAFELANPIFEKPLYAISGTISEAVVDAFIKRAEEVYGAQFG